MNNGNNEEQQYNNLVGNAFKKLQGGLAYLAKMIFKYVIELFGLPLLILLLIIFILSACLDTLLNTKGVRKEYQEIDTVHSNRIEYNSEDGTYEIVSMSPANRLIQSYYTYISQNNSYYVMVGNDKKMYSPNEAAEKYGEKTSTTETVINGTIDEDVADDVVAEAMKYLGSPYLYGASGEIANAAIVQHYRNSFGSNVPYGYESFVEGKQVFDCSGFTQYVYKKFGAVLPRTAAQQQNAGTEVPVDDVKPGDLIFWGNPAYHVLIYIGDGKVIHASQPWDYVKISDYDPSKAANAVRISGITADSATVDGVINGYQFGDKYKRENDFLLSIDLLYNMDYFLNDGVVYPEQFLKPVFADLDKFELKDLTDENGELVVESTKYKKIKDSELYEPTSDKTKGVWDYGLAPIFHYEKYEELKNGVGVLVYDEVWDEENQQIVPKELNEVDRATQIIEAMPGYPKTTWLIDKIITFGGAVKNDITYEYVNTGTPWSKTVSYEKEVKIKTTEYIHQKDKDGNLLYFDEEGKQTTEITDDPFVVPYVKEGYETRTFTRTFSGTVWESIPKVKGDPDLSNLKGWKYLTDYITNYSIFIPDNAVKDLEIKNKLRMTDNDLIKQLILLEEQEIEKYEKISSSSEDKEEDITIEIPKPGEVPDGEYTKEYFADYDLRQSSNVTADQLNSAIEKNLAGRTSMLSGTGEAFIQAAIENKVDPIFLVALSAWESGWGTSDMHIRKNNYFSWTCYNGREEETCTIWPSKEEGVLDGSKRITDLYIIERQRYTLNQFVESPNCYACMDDGSPNTAWVDGVSSIMAELYNSSGAKPGEGYSNVASKGNGVDPKAWIKKYWEKIKINFPKVFDQYPDEYSKECIKYTYIPANIDLFVETVVKTILSFEENKPVSYYNNFTSEDFNERTKLLFLNPLNQNNNQTSSSGQSLGSKYFPTGYTKPLKMDSVNILKKHGETIDDGNTHIGIDISAPKGEIVYVVAKGEVQEVGENDKYGKYVMIRHEGAVYTTYANLDQVNLSKGDKVNKGDEVGTVGNSCKSESFTGLHFEIRSGGANVDPIWIFSSGGNNGEANGVPLYIQYKEPWTFHPYAGETIGVAGCGPTTMAMVASWAGSNGKDISSVDKNGDNVVDPIESADFATSQGYSAYMQGSYHTVITDYVRFIGCTWREANSDEEVVNALANNQLVVFNVRPGTLSSAPHFFLGVGVKDGNIMLNDPGRESQSYAVSGVTFPPSLVMGESKAVYIIELN